jgi:hypothetical protein
MIPFLSSFFLICGNFLRSTIHHSFLYIILLFLKAMVSNGKCCNVTCVFIVDMLVAN